MDQRGEREAYRLCCCQTHQSWNAAFWVPGRGNCSAGFPHCSNSPASDNKSFVMWAHSVESIIRTEALYPPPNIHPVPFSYRFQPCWTWTRSWSSTLADSDTPDLKRDRCWIYFLCFVEGDDCAGHSPAEDGNSLIIHTNYTVSWQLSARPRVSRLMNAACCGLQIWSSDESIRYIQAVGIRALLSGKLLECNRPQSDL